MLKEKTAQIAIGSKENLKTARAKLLELMHDNETFDFVVCNKHYRCWKRPETLMPKPKLNREEGTFIMQEVVVKPTIILRKINERL